MAEWEIAAAHRAIATVAAGDARLLQAGDCAESLAESGPAATAAKVAVLADLGDLVTRRTGDAVVLFGRLAGQYAKPRSQPTETVHGVELPVFRGHLVNAPEPDPHARAADPRRLIEAYRASARVLAGLRTHRQRGDAGPWASHEALVLDYESPQVRRGEWSGERYLASTHLPWIGERTRQLDHAHVRLLASVTNPVACKVGPGATPDDVVALCAALDPGRTPGRLTLIARMGAERVGALAPIARAVRRAGHPVVWLCDPMHGNTVRTRSGKKTRQLATMIREASRFRATVEGLGLHPGGLHLEVATTEVTECVGGPVPDEDAVGGRYESLCDPRLNPAQARELIRCVF
ncbi:3-deoxy-D-arabinoheptulosonate-7-phosphate synthase [Krasilnikovia cinnamomea]|uniref:Phospho-2-dehydro-3-deoxyheptonate aldolase n=1 Tax=Krasilnikovia cinnamomea TaxID=349313 RepID=A0A4Q7ZSL4_9ACTN|nr:3-deoxy-D-arabinoheptulosonate-7-phosphate synthase [Krasilnikovia cinnamomea]